MFSFVQACIDWTELLIEGVIERRRLAKHEATALIDQVGPSAFDTAQQIAQLTRQRGDKGATAHWLQVAKEIARREARG